MTSFALSPESELDTLRQYSTSETKRLEATLNDANKRAEDAARDRDAVKDQCSRTVQSSLEKVRR